MAPVFPVIMSGGSGTRLWPLSRKHYPKQFLKLVSDRTMLQETALRVNHLAPPIAVCNENHRFILAEQFDEVGIQPTSIILEPVPRNTAPAVALSAFNAMQIDEDAILVVLAADHIIKDTAKFNKALEEAIGEAQQGSLVTFGICPSAPETGFGYIQSSDKNALSDIVQFVEKPDSATAMAYLESGDFFWNSGMFVFQAKSFLEELERLNPDMYIAVSDAYSQAKPDLDFIRIQKSAFEKVPEDSIDYAVMEKTQKGKILPVDIGWNDIGSFSALWEVLDKDDDGNVALGDVVNIDSKNCLVQSENQFIATIGVEDLVIVSTKDSVLVTHRDKVQDV